LLRKDRLRAGAEHAAAEGDPHEKEDPPRESVLDVIFSHAHAGLRLTRGVMRRASCSRGEEVREVTNSWLIRSLPSRADLAKGGRTASTATSRSM
jgi:hypothetical protein